MKENPSLPSLLSDALREWKRRKADRKALGSWAKGGDRGASLKDASPAARMAVLLLEQAVVHRVASMRAEFPADGRGASLSARDSKDRPMQDVFPQVEIPLLQDAMQCLLDMTGLFEQDQDSLLRGGRFSNTIEVTIRGNRARLGLTYQFPPLLDGNAPSYSDEADKLSDEQERDYQEMINSEDLERVEQFEPKWEARWEELKRRYKRADEAIEIRVEVFA